MLASFRRRARARTAADFTGNSMQLYNSISPNPKVVRMKALPSAAA
jgi:hypothetical protein